MVSVKIEIDMNDFLKAVDEKLDEIATEVFANSQQIIVQKKIIDEGTLLKSGNINREYLKKTVIYTAPYADVIEFGRLPGTMPPLEPIKAWIKRKGIASEEKIISRIAWAILQNIKKKGLEPRAFLGPAVEQTIQGLRSK